MSVEWLDKAFAIEDKTTEDLQKIQKLLGEWCESRLKCDIIPAILFTADGKVVVIHYTGESEVMYVKSE